MREKVRHLSVEPTTTDHVVPEQDDFSGAEMMGEVDGGGPSVIAADHRGIVTEADMLSRAPYTFGILREHRMALAANHDILPSEYLHEWRRDLRGTFPCEEEHVRLWTQERTMLHRNDATLQPRDKMPLRLEAFSAAQDETPTPRPLTRDRPDRRRRPGVLRDHAMALSAAVNVIGSPRRCFRRNNP